MSVLRRVGSLLAVAIAALALAGPAAADFGPIELVSRGVSQPADKAEAPALSADGKFVAFQGSIGGLEGVFVKNLESGVFADVAVADAYGPKIGNLRGSAPSISADGRYVSFTTKARLDPANDLGEATPDVYVADIAHSPPSYELASARDGCDPAAETGCGLVYAGAGGSEASGRVALSADGKKVVFFTTAKSNLGGSPEDTPAGQVVLRDLAANTTTLVSVERDPDSGAMTNRPVPGGALLLSLAATPMRGASLSADGTTVAWLGAHLPAQVPLPPAEAQGIEESDAESLLYDEPLWRRVADGPQAPTRRIVGGSDGPFAFPALLSKDREFNSFQGWLGVTMNVNGIPRLSDDGRFVLSIGNPTEATNLFLIDMAPGLSRGQAVRQLTREIVIDPDNPGGTINSAPYLALTGHIFDLALSGDARRVAFATYRQQFPLAPPNLIGLPPSSGNGMVELYLIDLDSEALQRVTHGLGGAEEASTNPAKEPAPSGGDGASAPSLGAGGLIAFASTASNLVAADTNEASDAFLVDGGDGEVLPEQPTIDPGPAPIKTRPPWRLTLSATSLPDGSVKVVAAVPAAGRLRASVGPEPDDRELRPRRLADGGVRVRKAGRTAIEFELPPRLRRLARKPEGVYGIARVSFHHPGRRTLRGKVQVRFRVHGKQQGSRR